MSSKSLGNPNPMLKSVGNKNGAKIGNLGNCVKPVGMRNSNLEKMPKQTLTAEQRKKIVEDMRNSMNQYKKQQQTKKPSVGATLKYAFKKAFSKKPKKEQPRQMASKIQVVPHKAKK